MLIHILIGVLYAVVGYMVVDAPVKNPKSVGESSRRFRTT
jgi:hypothetical protein